MKRYEDMRRLLLEVLQILDQAEDGAAQQADSLREAREQLDHQWRETEALHRECDQMRENIAMLEEERRKLHEEIRRLRQDAAGE